jgi:hypothetical protein
VAITFKRFTIGTDAIIVVFDFCSSSELVEALTLRGSVEPYKALLTSIKRHLAAAQKSVTFDPYKFTGDGWILLFPSDTSGAVLWEFLLDLCDAYRRVYRENLLPHLETPPRVEGLTFGIEQGPIHNLTIFRQSEYLGRSLAIACRLQNAVRDNRAPGYKALVTAAFFRQYFSDISELRAMPKRLQFRNIREGRDFKAHSINLRPHMAFNRTRRKTASVSRESPRRAG